MRFSSNTSGSSLLLYDKLHINIDHTNQYIQQLFGEYLFIDYGQRAISINDIDFFHPERIAFLLPTIKTIISIVIVINLIIIFTTTTLTTNKQLITDIHMHGIEWPFLYQHLFIDKIELIAQVRQ